MAVLSRATADDFDVSSGPLGTFSCWPAKDSSLSVQKRWRRSVSRVGALYELMPSDSESPAKLALRRNDVHGGAGVGVYTVQGLVVEGQPTRVHGHLRSPIREASFREENFVSSSNDMR